VQIVKSLAAASLLAAAAPATPPPPPSVAPVVEAERAFARMAQEKGSAEAFRTFIAEDGQMFLPRPTRAKPLLEAGKIPIGPLRWWPVYAGIATSGDLGFTTGPAIVGTGPAAGHAVFFTIWKRQRDGGWRWVMDKGVSQRAEPPGGESAPVQALAAGTPRGSAAWAEVSAAEAALAKALATDARRALVDALAPDGRLLRNGPPPAIGRKAVQAVLAEEPVRMATAPIGGEASAAGDLAYTYGTASWTDESGARTGHYLRVWQHRARGWRVVIDQTSAPPAARAAGG